MYILLRASQILPRPATIALPCFKKSSSPIGVKSPCGSSGRCGRWASARWLSTPTPTAPRSTCAWPTRPRTLDLRHRRTATSALTASSMRLAGTAHKRSIPATAFCRKTPSSPPPATARASCSSAHPPSPFDRWDRRRRRGAWRRAPACRSSPEPSAAYPASTTPEASPTPAAIR